MTPDRGRRLVIMWSPPRCRSTAFSRMMSERGDVTVVHEPFSNRAGQGHFDVGDRRETTETGILDALLDMARTGTVFTKDTTDYRYLDLLDDRRLRTEVRNTFIIRDPAEAINSHYAVSPGLTSAEVGFEQCWEIFERTADGDSGPPVVVDAADLMRAPDRIVALYCERVGLPYRAEALRWSEGHRREWERTARWHTAVARTTGFEAPPVDYAVRVDNDARLAELYEHHLPFYRNLHALRLVPDDDVPAAGRG